MFRNSIQYEITLEQFLLKARLVRELERTEKAELAKREKEARSQQLLEVLMSTLTLLCNLFWGLILILNSFLYWARAFPIPFH